MYEYNNDLSINVLVFLDEKLSFLVHIDVKIKKATEGVNLMRKPNLLLPRSPCEQLITALSNLIWTMEISFMIN